MPFPLLDIVSAYLKVASLTETVCTIYYQAPNEKSTLCKIPRYLFTAGYKVEPISIVQLKYNWVTTRGGGGRHCLGIKLLQIRHS